MSNSNIQRALQRIVRDNPKVPFTELAKRYKTTASNLMRAQDKMQRISPPQK